MKRHRPPHIRRQANNKPPSPLVPRSGALLSFALLAAITGAVAVHAVRLEAQLASEHAGMAETAARLERLELRGNATKRIIAEASQSIVFVQGAYGFNEGTTGRPLRYFRLGADGEPMRNSAGQPLITLDGDGPIVERLFTGTAFVVSDDGWLLTNRHVVEPWTADAGAQALYEHGLVPTVQRFVGYLANVNEPFALSLVAASDDVDLAILRGVLDGGAQPLALSSASPLPGDDVVVLGYPTGLKALVARASAALESELASGGTASFWAVARRLSNEGSIRPLATRGIIGQVGPAAILYDAETTSGGSGGPVLALNGEVVAVNTAVLPEFGGANLGVPAAHVRALLALARKLSLAKTEITDGIPMAE